MCMSPSIVDMSPTSLAEKNIFVYYQPFAPIKWCIVVMSSGYDQSDKNIIFVESEFHLLS